MMQALRGEPLTVYGDGEQTRSFCYVDDLIEGILLLSRSKEHLPVNLGNPGEFTIEEWRAPFLKLPGRRVSCTLTPCRRTIPPAAVLTSQRRAHSWVGTAHSSQGGSGEIAGILPKPGWLQVATAEVR